MLAAIRGGHASNNEENGGGVSRCFAVALDEKVFDLDWWKCQRRITKSDGREFRPVKKETRAVVNGARESQRIHREVKEDCVVTEHFKYSEVAEYVVEWPEIWTIDEKSVRKSLFLLYSGKLGYWELRIQKLRIPVLIQTCQNQLNQTSNSLIPTEVVHSGNL